MSGPFGSSQWMYASGDYEIDNSVRFNHPDAPHMKRTPSSAGNRRTFTMSIWYKPSIVVSSDSNPQLFSGRFTFVYYAKFTEKARDIIVGRGNFGT